MTATVDWEDLARILGSIRDAGEASSTAMATQAIELILGEEVMREAVDHYISRRPGGELARAVLWHIHPWSAMERCYQIYRNGKDLEDRRAAVELLRVVADRRAMPWVSDFLQDPDPVIQQWGLGIVDQLAFAELIAPDEARKMLDAVRDSEHQYIREKIAFVETYLRQRETQS